MLPDRTVRVLTAVALRAEVASPGEVEGLSGVSVYRLGEPSPTKGACLAQSVAHALTVGRGSDIPRSWTSPLSVVGKCGQVCDVSGEGTARRRTDGSSPGGPGESYAATVDRTARTLEAYHFAPP